MIENDKTDIAWVREQLYRAGYSRGAREQSIGTSVELLLRRLNEMVLLAPDRHEVVQLFTRLASGAPIAPANVTGEAVWVDLTSAGTEVEVGDVVRVRPDAFDGDLGEQHNGATGELVGVRGGDYVVNYASTLDTTGVHLTRDVLQVLARTTR